MLGWLRHFLPVAPARPAARTAPVRSGLDRVRRLNLGWDAAKTTDDNRRHWANADDLSPMAGVTMDARELRRRSQYERQNNCYAAGIGATLANDVVGVGPRLQLLTDSSRRNHRVEVFFESWSERIDLAAKLRQLREARFFAGDGLAAFATNKRLAHPVQLDVRVTDAEQWDTPWFDAAVVTRRVLDGIEFDDDNQPVYYYRLKDHPGDTFFAPRLGFDRLSASQVVHLFRPLRPGQHRGVPEIAPALGLFAELRRYTQAVVRAAEIAADFAAVLEQEMDPDQDRGEKVEAFDLVPVDRGMMATLPPGVKMHQFDAKQPTTAYREFKHELLNEAARVIGMPFNVAAGNSSGYNYSSGRLDHQTYYRSLRIDRREMERLVLDKLLEAFLRELVLAVPGLPLDAELDAWPHEWQWPGHEHVDPVKEAVAQETRLRSLATTYAAEYARQGEDWERAFEQIARERRKLADLEREYGVSMAAAGMPSPDDPDDDDDEQPAGQRQEASHA